MTTATPPLDAVDRLLLEELQQQLPLDHRPFQLLGQRLGLSEQDGMARIDRLKTAGFIRGIFAVFDPAAFGYQLTLAAMKVDPSRMPEAAAVINRHPGVARSDTLNDPFNLWFTIGVPPADSLEHTINLLHALAKADETILLPARRIYKGGLAAALPAEASWLEAEGGASEPAERFTPKVTLTDQDIRFIRAAQGDLPLLEIPYAVWAEQAESTEHELFAWAARARHQGYLLRVAAAAASPQPAGWESATVVWQVSEGDLDAIGETLARMREVSHCSRRPIYANWPYALFTVIRARSAAACMEAVKRMEERAGRFPRKHLFSARVHRQARLAYFSPALDSWRHEAGLSASA